METNKKTTISALALAAAVGAAGNRLVNPPLPESARTVALISADHKYGAQVQVQAGAARGVRILNWDQEGKHTLLDSRPFDNEAANDIGNAAATFANTANRLVADLFRNAQSFRLISAAGGYGLQVTVIVDTQQKTHFLNWGPDGKTPSIDSQPVDRPEMRELGQAAVSFFEVADRATNEMVDKLVL